MPLPVRSLLRMFVVLPVALGLLFLVGGCVGKSVKTEPAPYHDGQLVMPDGAPAAERDFLRLAASAEYVLLGERHDNALDHKLQALLLKNLAEEGKQPVLGLEMLPRKQYDAALAAFSGGRTGLDELPATLDWPRTWGFDFNLYREVFAVAGQHSIPVFGLNIPNDLRKSVSRKGLEGLSASEKRGLPRKIVPPLPEQREKLRTFFQGHYAMIASRKAGGLSSDETSSAVPAVAQKPVRGMPATTDKEDGAAMQTAFERFLLVQSLWDSTMAETATRVRQKTGGVRPVVIIVGGGHVEYGYGIASRLKVFDPTARSLLVMPFSGQLPEPDAAHLFFYSPQPDAPVMPRQEKPAVAAAAGQRERIGLTLEQADGKLRVAGVTPGSRAERAGIVAGDILERAGSHVVAAAEDLHKAALEAKRQGSPMSIALQRRGEFVAVYIH